MTKFFAKCRGFTLVEVIIASLVMVVFMTGVYQLFIGSSRSASRSQWINGTVDQMRNATTFLTREIRASTYPTTLFSDTFYDPADNDDWSVPEKFYLRILKDGEAINTPAAGELKIMSWVVCEPERPGNEPGKITENELYLVHKQNTTEGPIGDLQYHKRTFNYTTDPNNNYARSGRLTKTAIPEETFNRPLVSDVQHVLFSIAGILPTERPLNPTTFYPLSITIRTRFPFDIKVFRENPLMATPQVAIDTF